MKEMVRGSETAGLLALVAIVAVALLGLVGWVLNIVALFGSDLGEITGMFVLRIVGVVIPFIGAILGWFF